MEHLTHFLRHAPAPVNARQADLRTKGLHAYNKEMWVI